MKITLCYSMQFAEKAEEVKKWLENNGHTAFVSSVNAGYLGLDDLAKEK